MTPVLRVFIPTASMCGDSAPSVVRVVGDRALSNRLELCDLVEAMS